MNVEFQHKLCVYRFVVTYFDTGVGIVACQLEYSVVAAEEDAVGPRGLSLCGVVIGV